MYFDWRDVLKLEGRLGVDVLHSDHGFSRNRNEEHNT